MEMDAHALRVKSLASGSSANAYLVECAGGALLVDAGLSGRELQARLRQHTAFKVPLLGILITHEHGDHTAGARGLARLVNAPIVATPGTLKALALSVKTPYRELPAGNSLTLGPFEIHAFRTPHDAVDSVGYRIVMGKWRVGIATDLGHCAPQVFEALRDTHLTIIEANHDRARLMANRSYSTPLKHRISGDTGHLANEQTAAFLQQLAEVDQDRWVWLAHLSEENNHPSTAVAAMHRHFGVLRREMPFALQVAERDKPSVEWDTRSLFRQRALF